MDDDRTPILKKPRPHKSNCFLCLLTSCAALSGLLFGYNTRIMSMSKISLRKFFHLSSSGLDVILSGIISMSAISSVIAGTMADQFGRSKTILLSCLIFTIGAVLTAFCHKKMILIFGHISVNTAVGISSMVIPIYLAEIAPREIRGTLITINQFFVSVGITIANVVTALFRHMGKDAWRFMLGLAAIPSLIQFGAFYFLPESPRWLVANGHSEDARAVLHKVHPTDTAADEEHKGITAVLSLEKGKKLFKEKHVMVALVIGCAMQLFQQFGGFNGIVYYNATIIEMSGISEEITTMWSSTSVSSLNMVFTMVGVVLVDRSGRRILSIISLSGMTLSCLVLAIGFQWGDKGNKLPVTFWQPSENNTTLQCENYRSCGHCVKNIHCAYCYSPTGPLGTNSSCVFYSNKSLHDSCHTSHLTKGLIAPNYCPSDYAWVNLLGLTMYIMFFSPGMGPMPWVINTEIYPNWARATCASVSDGIHWISTFVISSNFISLADKITIPGTFWLYFGVCAVGTLFIIHFLPETKGKSLEETEHLFKSKEKMEDSKVKGGNQNISDSQVKGSNQNLSDSQVKGSNQNLSDSQVKGSNQNLPNASENKENDKETDEEQQTQN